MNIFYVAAAFTTLGIAISCTAMKLYSIKNEKIFYKKLKKHKEQVLQENSIDTEIINQIYNSLRVERCQSFRCCDLEVIITANIIYCCNNKLFYGMHYSKNENIIKAVLTHVKDAQKLL